MKSRGVYETPGGTILLTARRAVESVCLDRGEAHLKVCAAVPVCMAPLCGVQGGETRCRTRVRGLFWRCLLLWLACRAGARRRRPPPSPCRPRATSHHRRRHLTPRPSCPQDDLMPRYAELVYNGFWFSPERLALQVRGCRGGSPAKRPALHRLGLASAAAFIPLPSSAAWLRAASMLVRAAPCPCNPCMQPPPPTAHRIRTTPTYTGTGGQDPAVCGGHRAGQAVQGAARGCWLWRLWRVCGGAAGGRQASAAKPQRAGCAPHRLPSAGTTCSPPPSHPPCHPRRAT